MTMYRVRTVFNGPQGTPWLSTMFFDAAGGTHQQAAAAVGAFWGAVDALQTNQVAWATEPDVAEISEANGGLEGVESTTPVTGSGALSVEPLPWVSQGLLRWRTSTTIFGRQLRGRTFIPALCTGATDDGNLTATQATTLNGIAAALIADANSTLVIWHRQTADGNNDGDMAPVTSGTMWQSFATLRSRRD